MNASRLVSPCACANRFTLAPPDQIAAGGLVYANADGTRGFAASSYMASDLDGSIHHLNYVRAPPRPACLPLAQSFAAVGSVRSPALACALRCRRPSGALLAAAQDSAALAARTVAKDVETVPSPRRRRRLMRPCGEGRRG